MLMVNQHLTYVSLSVCPNSHLLISDTPLHTIQSPYTYSILFFPYKIKQIIV